MIMKYIYALSLLTVLSSCNASPSVSARKENTQQTNPPVFKMVDIPTVLTSPEERAEYLVLNYWNKFDFADTAYIAENNVLEQAFVDYIDILPHTKYETAVGSLKKTMGKAAVEKKMYARFFELFEKYLYEPNSPMRNEELFIPVLENVVASPQVDEVNKVRPRNLLQLALKNRPGEQANDFRFTLADGQTLSLHKVKAEYLLLFFYNPGCVSCESAKDNINVSNIITPLLASGKLKIAAIYTDEELDEWKNYTVNIPEQWINGYDRDVYIKNEEVYDLKASPTIYLLDKDKKVLLKDVYVNQVEDFLASGKH